MGAWLQEAVGSRNWPLAGQVLTLLDTSPMTVTRLKRTTTPKLVKELSRDCPSEGESRARFKADEMGFCFGLSVVLA